MQKDDTSRNASFLIRWLQGSGRQKQDRVSISRAAYAQECRSLPSFPSHHILHSTIDALSAAIGRQVVGKKRHERITPYGVAGLYYYSHIIVFTRLITATVSAYASHAAACPFRHLFFYISLSLSRAH